MTETLVGVGSLKNAAKKSARHGRAGARRGAGAGRAGPRQEGVELVGPGGLLTGLTKTSVLEAALEAELERALRLRQAPARRRDADGGTTRNGTRAEDGADGGGRRRSSWRCRGTVTAGSSRRSCTNASGG